MIIIESIYHIIIYLSKQIKTATLFVSPIHIHKLQNGMLDFPVNCTDIYSEVLYHRVLP